MSAKERLCSLATCADTKAKDTITQFITYENIVALQNYINSYIYQYYDFLYQKALVPVATKILLFFSVFFFISFRLSWYGSIIQVK